MNYRDKLKNWLNWIGVVSQLMEAVFAIFAGTFLGWWLGGEAPNWINYLTFGCFFVFAILFSLRLFSSHIFTAEAVDAEHLRIELTSTQADLVKTKSLFENLDLSVQRLNEETCSIGKYNQDYDNFANDISVGLSEVAHPVVNSPNSLLQCSVARYSIFALVRFTPPLEPVKKNDRAPSERHVIKLRDDLKISGRLISSQRGMDVVDDSDSTGIRLEIGNFLKTVLNNKIYREETCSNDGANELGLANGATFIGVPIPLICDDSDADGVLLIAAGTSIKCCSDVPIVLHTYARLVANWLHHYSDYNYDTFMAATSSNRDSTTGEWINEG